MYWFNFIGSVVNFINRVAKFLIKKKKKTSQFPDPCS